jgi:hypothetical protein
MKPGPDNHGYLQLSLNANGRSEHWKLHRLVAKAFLGIQPEGTEVCHNDGDKTNNAPANLRYDTRLANEDDKRRHGTHQNTRKTHCPRGHEYTPENTYVNPKGSRECRTCTRARKEEDGRIAKERRRQRGLMPNTNSAKTHCPQGHPYDEENTYLIPSNGRRMCRACIRARSARRRAA